MVYTPHATGVEGVCPTYSSQLTSPRDRQRWASPLSLSPSPVVREPWGCVGRWEGGAVGMSVASTQTRLKGATFSLF